MVSNMSKSKIFLSALAVTAFGLLAQAQDLPVLMHLNPVALDASGQPVTDLTAADFKIVDNGKPETIYFFQKPDVGPAAPWRRWSAPTGQTASCRTTTAILFDMINLVDADRLENWKSSTSRCRSSSPARTYTSMCSISRAL